MLPGDGQHLTTKTHPSPYFITLPRVLDADLMKKERRNIMPY